MEKFLPGEYFYCLATQSYGENKHRYADKFFKEAASWASKPAQYVLGVMALNGDQQPVNRPLALAWFALASERQGRRSSVGQACTAQSEPAASNESHAWRENMEAILEVA